MFIRQIGKETPKGVLFLAVCLFLLTACGSNTSASSGALATATACARIKPSVISVKATIGTLKSFHKNTLVLTDTQKKSVTVTYSSATTFTREVKIPASALKEGTPVSVTVVSTGSTYTAISVLVGGGTGTIIDGGSGPGGAPVSRGTVITTNSGPGGTVSGSNGTPATTKGGGGNNPCAAQPGGANTPSATSHTNSHTLVGTVSQVHGTLLTVTDYTGAPYTATLTAQTQIIGSQSASATALKVGEPLTVVGKPGNQNTVAASTIEILLSLSTNI